MTELGAKAVAELELLSPAATAAAAAADAASACATSHAGGSLEGVVSDGGGSGEGGGGTGRGLVSGLEVLWECVLDDAAGDARWETSPLVQNVLGDGSSDLWPTAVWSFML